MIFNALAHLALCSSIATQHADAMSTPSSPDLSERAANATPPSPATANPKIAALFRSTTRSTTWTQTNSIHLDFQTYHPQGLAITPQHLFLTSVEIITPTVPYPQPQNGYDRTPGKGIGHLFVLDHNGTLVKDIQLHEGDKYHPGGIDFDGTHVWVPLAEYRPNSAASIYRVNAKTLKVHKQFNANDHFGGIVYDLTRNQLVGNNWASRNFTTWKLDGTVVTRWANQNFFVDFQDCQYIQPGQAICLGVASLPTATSAGAPTNELGGLSLLDLHAQGRILHEIPVTQYSTVSHSITRNPAKLRVVGGKLQLMVAPDDGSEPGGTDILTFEAS